MPYHHTYIHTCSAPFLFSCCLFVLLLTYSLRGLILCNVPCLIERGLFEVACFVFYLIKSCSKSVVDVDVETFGWYLRS
ncbi:hypothetical protein B0H65DRAFT_468818 [Neurospora tetraspora]|uniref:Uncharacterized protein n=1 Tax=Neurospora tetraspora TaxID=94610 RepID=A0AAE0JD70_9PEZI|nr:hypothetical protein B0H65DRAFT_468818 [Neurospora tetraspora]